VDLGFKIDLPEDVLINLYMRSGLALRKGLSVVGKRIYGSNEEVCVEIRNYSEEVYRASKGDRIVQMVFHEVLTSK
ncbi:dUTPase, partial [Trachipleistophora hominis]